MERAEIERRAKGLIHEHLGCEPEKVTDDANFIEDLGADSLDMVELTMAFEEEFGCDILDEEIEKVDLVKDAYDLLEKKGV